jgi:hypothetical protein
MPYGTGLDTAFNQDEPQQNINTHPKKVKTPEGLEKRGHYQHGYYEPIMGPNEL